MKEHQNQFGIVTRVNVGNVNLILVKVPPSTMSSSTVDQKIFVVKKIFCVCVQLPLDPRYLLRATRSLLLDQLQLSCSLVYQEATSQSLCRFDHTLRSQSYPMFDRHSRAGSKRVALQDCFEYDKLISSFFFQCSMRIHGSCAYSTRAQSYVQSMIRI